MLPKKIELSNSSCLEQKTLGLSQYCRYWIHSMFFWLISSDADSWRFGSSLWNWQTVPKWRHWHDTQPRIHNPWVLHGLCWLQWPYVYLWDIDFWWEKWNCKPIFSLLILHHSVGHKFLLFSGFLLFNKVFM